MRSFYFGGQFRFRYKDCNMDLLAKDYRSLLLGDKKEIWINRPECGYVDVNINTRYIGPFYFYDQIDSETVVDVESSSISKATDCVFVLSNDDAPGTVTEIIQATMLKKNVYIFFEKKDLPKEEVDTKYPSNLWYPITFACMNNNPNVKYCMGFDTYDDAVKACINYFKNTL